MFNLLFFIFDKWFLYIKTVLKIFISCVFFCFLLCLICFYGSCFYYLWQNWTRIYEIRYFLIISVYFFSNVCFNKSWLFYYERTRNMNYFVFLFWFGNFNFLIFEAFECRRRRYLFIHLNLLFMYTFERHLSNLRLNYVIWRYQYYYILKSFPIICFIIINSFRSTNFFS